MADKGETVAINVGPKHQAFTIGERQLVGYSDYFREALKNSRSHTILLPEIDPEVFSIFVDWLQSQQKDPVDWSDTYSGLNKTGLPASLTTSEVDLELIKALILADRLAAWDFKKAINNYYVNLLVYNQVPPDHDAVAYAFNHFPWDHPITRLMVDADCIYGDANVPETSRLPRDFVNRRARRSQELKINGNWALKPCS